MRYKLLVKLFVVLHLIGPALLFYSIAYFFARPDDWTGPAVMIPVGLIITLLAQYFGLKRIRKETKTYWRIVLIGTQIAGPVGGVIIGVMIYLLLTNRL
ncbi:MAG: hypothetical protein HYU99_04740 [Deltaproteobacteria bacterium]|nr:hypothetical protein [Deltaproteobacteria bacterium]